MNKFTLLALILCFIGIAFACDDFNPNTSTIGQCTGSQKVGWVPTDNAPVLTPADLDPTELAVHEERMNYILQMGTALKRKFIASIYHQNGTLMCTGVNMGKPNIISHGEIVAINNCTAMHGITVFTNYTLYTTGEPCAMCASALLWADFKTIVWGTYNADLLCKICMSNIPMDSAYIFGRYYGLRSTAPRVIGGVLRSQADAFFGSYCSNPNSIYYIKPRCACTNTTSPLKIEQTQYSSWFEGGVTKTQFGGVITNTAQYTVTNPTFTSTGVKPTSIWGMVNEANTDNWSLQWYPVIQAGQTYSFGYIITGTEPITFQPTA
ncbi:hypothetical protein DICPUDRAFT_154567 [Dictyostelium purpureum]|uniref:CMP/dCMP-type deaminase domain-containing protein n=1 Tax=Dictyostelium purpureum TaxID=5786 RepID=F0ZRP0_DICPU|nr:uncharacterized protein DICPUDRAFT_154567 [Dictyostelium purpureum]EGC33374.1 hypothetical protein DICPUDRAFT_154567 [Dictyostelium purpureum]|eukprot:XP_003290082.1 hypothetical protein DICPUDRAFT_154567 [Dictyostelium purpureum]